jgi:hypothetical protein
MFRLYMLQATEASLGRASRVVFGMCRAVERVDGL